MLPKRASAKEAHCFTVAGADGTEQKYCENRSRQELTGQFFPRMQLCNGPHAPNCSYNPLCCVNSSLAPNFGTCSSFRSFFEIALSSPATGVLGIMQVGRQVFPHTTTHCQQATSFSHSYAGVGPPCWRTACQCLGLSLRSWQPHQPPLRSAKGRTQHST